MRPRLHRPGSPVFVQAVLWSARTGCPWRDPLAETEERNAVHAHRKRGARGQAIGRSCGGMTTTAMTDALGDIVGLRSVAGQTCTGFLADRAFDANRLRDALTAQGSPRRIRQISPKTFRWLCCADPIGIHVVNPVWELTRMKEPTSPSWKATRGTARQKAL